MDRLQQVVLSVALFFSATTVNVGVVLNIQPHIGEELIRERDELKELVAAYRNGSMAGIITQGALWSVNLLILNGPNKALPWNALVFIEQNNIHSLWKIAIVVVVIVLALYWFFGTELGASIRATGNNQRMSRAIGINTKFNTVLGLMISNGLVALSGAILTQFQGSADIKMGMGAIVIGLCSVVIGLTITSKITQNFLVRMVGVVGGAIIYYIIYQVAVTFLNDPNWLKLLASVIVALFLGIPYVYKKHLAKHFKKKERVVKEG